MDPSSWSRLQFAFTATYHYLFPQLTMGLALLIFLLKTRALRTQDPHLDATARFWARIFAITFATGVVTGIMLDLARVAGETAPLLFTALGNQFYTTDVTAPMDSLPRRIYIYATGPYDYWHEQAWAMSLILVAVILVISLSVRALFGSRVTVRQ